MGEVDLSGFEAPSRKELADFLIEETEETTTDSQPETVVKEGAPSQEATEEKPAEKPAETEDSALDNVPFHKHPRWKRMQQELKEAREALAKRAEPEAKPVVQESAPQTDEEIELIRLFGDNQDVLKLFRQRDEKMKAKFLDAARKEMQSILENERSQQERVEQQRQQILTNLENTLADMSDEAGVDLTNPRSTIRNQLLNIVEEYNLMDAEGIPNLSAAWRLHQKLYPRSSDVDEKRKIVAKTGTKTNSNVQEDLVFTPKRLREIEKAGGMSYFLNN